MPASAEMACQRCRSLLGEPDPGRSTGTHRRCGCRHRIENRAGGGGAQRQRAQDGLAVGEVDGGGSDVAPAQCQHLAEAATGESEQADGGDALGPSGLMPVEGAAEAFKPVRVEEAADLAPGVLADAEIGIGAVQAGAPLQARNIMAGRVSSARLAAPAPVVSSQML